MAVATLAEPLGATATAGSTLETEVVEKEVSKDIPGSDVPNGVESEVEIGLDVAVEGVLFVVDIISVVEWFKLVDIVVTMVVVVHIFSLTLDDVLLRVVVVLLAATKLVRRNYVFHVDNNSNGYLDLSRIITVPVVILLVTPVVVLPFMLLLVLLVVSVVLLIEPIVFFVSIWLAAAALALDPLDLPCDEVELGMLETDLILAVLILVEVDLVIVVLVLVEVALPIVLSLINWSEL